MDGITSRILESWNKAWNIKRLNIPVTQSLKSWMEKKGMTGSWSQGPGLVRKKMNKIIISIQMINNVVLTSVKSIAVIWTRMSSESRLTEKIQDKQD